MSARYACPVCGTPKHLDAEGRIKRHRVDDVRAGTVWITTCAGSGQQPEEQNCG